jgi:polyisoprenoid-binding protein YceI
MRTSLFTASILALAATVSSCGGNSGEAIEATDAVEVEDVAASATYTVENGSTLHWEGFKTYASGKHDGLISITEGQLMTEGSEIIGGMFTIDMNSIALNDMQPENEYYGKLVGHLKSDDFFNAEMFPTSKFEISSVEASADEMGNTHLVSGNLTIRDISKNITFPAKVMMHDDMVHLSAPSFTIDRTQWNVMYDSENTLGELTDGVKEKLIDHNIKLDFDLKATKG